MKSPDFGELDRQVARARLVLSLLTMFTLYIDPSDSGIFHLSGAPLIIIMAHLAYSLGVYFAVARRPPLMRRIGLTIVLDLAFAAAIALCTEGTTSPSYAFFVFAIVAAGFRSGFRATVAVTAASVALYLIVIGFLDGITNSYMMRGAYLAIAGYLICFFGEQRAAFEARLRELESKAERLTIARSLHDGYVQSLAGVNLRLETCRQLLRRQEEARALRELTELQAGVGREYDAVRSYIRSLAETDRPIRDGGPCLNDPRFEMRLEFSAPGRIVEQILQIALEGLRNAWRHGKAGLVRIDAHGARDMIQLTISDDGVGFRDPSTTPWTIASRVAEFGGKLRVASGGSSGSLLEIQMPAS